MADDTPPTTAAIQAARDALRNLMSQDPHATITTDEDIVRTILDAALPHQADEIERLRTDLGQSVARQNVLRAERDQARDERDSMVRDLLGAVYPGDPMPDRPLDTVWNHLLDQVRAATVPAPAADVVETVAIWLFMSRTGSLSDPQRAQRHWRDSLDEREREQWRVYARRELAGLERPAGQAPAQPDPDDDPNDDLIPRGPLAPITTEESHRG